MKKKKQIIVIIILICRLKFREVVYGKCSTLKGETNRSEYFNKICY